jgi:hypothetical protein
LDRFALFPSRFGDRIHCQDAITFPNLEEKETADLQATSGIAESLR